MKLYDLDIEVIHKKIKNVYLSVCPPHGQVKVSAPKAMPFTMIRAFVTSKFKWIKKQQEKLRAQVGEQPKTYVNQEIHYFQGTPYLLQIVENNTPPQVSLSESQLVLHLPPNTTPTTRGIILEAWYEQQLREQVDFLMRRWEEKIGVSVLHWSIRKMKTRWGSCTPARRSIRINLELAKRPIEHLEYIVVHELVHLLEPSHNKRFAALMDQFLPKWRVYRAALNRESIQQAGEST